MEFNPASGILDFFVVSSGVAVSAVVGFIFARIVYYIDDYLVETTFTTCMAFGAFLLAEGQLHVSGVLAVVMAGLVHGRMGWSNMSEETEVVVQHVWEYLAYVANAAIFLLIGLTIDIPDLLDNLPLMLGTIGIVLVARAVVVYGLGGVLHWISSRRFELPLNWRHVLFRGGQRGAVSLALVLSISSTLSESSDLRIMTSGVVLFTTLVQSTTMPVLLYWLGIYKEPEHHIDEDGFSLSLF